MGRLFLLEEATMTAAQLAARGQVNKVTLKDIGRSLNPVAERLLAFWAGDMEAAKRSLFEMPVQSQVREMLCLAMDTVKHRRERRLDRELNGLRIRRGRWC